MSDYGQNTEAHFVLIPWLEVAKLHDGGYMVFDLGESGHRRRPTFAGTTIEEVFVYLRSRFEPTPRPIPTDTGGR